MHHLPSLSRRQWLTGALAAWPLLATARAAADGDSVIPTSADGAPPASIAALRLLPPEHWLKGTL